MSEFLNRVRFFTTSTGTGDLVVGTVYDSVYFTPAEAGASNGQLYTWVITQGGDVEITVAAYSTAGGGTIVRSTGTTLISRIGGTVGTSKINLVAGQTEVHIDAAAQDLVSSSSLRNANTVWAGPGTGSPATPTFRALVGADMPQPYYYPGGTPVAITDGGTGQSTAGDAFDALKQAATDTYVGAVELAIAAEVSTGTDTTRATTPASISGAAIYGNIPQVNMSADYTLQLSDMSKHIFHNEDNNRTLTVPPNSSVPFPIGATILVVNNANTLTLKQGSGVYFVWVPSITGGDRTLAIGGVATLLHIGSNFWYVYGVGIS